MLKVKENLRKILKEREDLTVASLARKAGIPKANLQTWLTGSTPNIEQLDKVAKALGVSLEYLAFGRTDEEKMDALIEKVMVHTGTYEISVKKILKKNL